VDGGWIEQVQCRVQWRAVVLAVLNLWVSLQDSQIKIEKIEVDMICNTQETENAFRNLVHQCNGMKLRT
jgi:hypothetical protein